MSSLNSTIPKVTKSGYELAKKLISIYFPLKKPDLNNNDIPKQNRIIGGTDYEKFEKIAIEVEREDILSKKDILKMANPNDIKIQRQMFEGSSKPKIEACLIFKNEGDFFLKNKKIKNAINSYEKALLQLFYNFNDVEEEKRKIKKIKLSINLNLSLCLMKEEKYKDAVGYLLEAKRLDSNNLKTFYRLSYCYIQVHNYDDAKKMLKEGFKINENSPELKQLESEIEKKEKEENNKKGKLLKKFMNS